MESAMLLLLIVLVCILTYILFSPTSIIGPWLDRHCRKERNSWSGEDVEPKYQEGTPFIPALDTPFEDPEVPHRPSKKKKPKKKRVYKRRKKK